MVIDLLVVVNALSNRKSIKPKVFGEFSEYVFVELNNLSRRSARIDIVCDLYPEGLNLKESIQIERVIMFNQILMIPSFLLTSHQVF